MLKLQPILFVPFLRSSISLPHPLSPLPVYNLLPYPHPHQTRFLSRNYTAESIEAMKELDDVLAQLAVSAGKSLPSGILASFPVHWSGNEAS